MTSDEEQEPIQVDAYLDALLAGRFAGPQHPGGRSAPPELEAAAGLVQRALSRFHPSFAFEERLAARLDAVATDRASTHRASPAPPVDIRHSILRTARDDRRPRSGLLVGGAIASGVSIAGAAFLRRRRGRPNAHAPIELRL